MTPILSAAHLLRIVHPGHQIAVTRYGQEDAQRYVVVAVTACQAGANVIAHQVEVDTVELCPSGVDPQPVELGWLNCRALLDTLDVPGADELVRARAEGGE